MSILSYGYRPTTTFENIDGIPARVTAVHRDLFEIVCDEGTGLARLKTGEYRPGGESLPTTGDFVLLNWQPNGESRIVKTLPRKTYFSRLDPSSSGHGEQAVAANFDYVFILQPLDRDFNPHSLERYLTLAWQSGAVPAVVLTKADTLPESDCAARLRAAERLAVGAGVFAVSSKTGLGLERLGDYTSPGKTIVFLGASGAGKSSLINALAGSDVMATGGVREKDGRGRHTTTHRQLLLLESGVMVIDTPGMRELGMWDVSEGLGQSFADVEQYLGHCKFSDCSHGNEPGCAVREAIRRGELGVDRWESYVKLSTEARYCDDKDGYLRAKKQWTKDLAKLQKQHDQNRIPGQKAHYEIEGKNKSQKQSQPDYRREACRESFTCKACGAPVAPDGAGSEHRNHCPACLASLHVDNKPGDRASLCGGVMDAIGVWVRKNGEWAIIHRCRECGELSSNRVAADDNPTLLMSIAVKPLAAPPFPLSGLVRGAQAE